MKLCNKCGKQLSDNSSFCDSCGNNLTNCNDLIFEYNGKKINLTNIVRMYDAKSAAKIISEELGIPRMLSKKIVKSAVKGNIEYINDSIVKKYKILNIVKWASLSFLALLVVGKKEKEKNHQKNNDLNAETSINVKSDTVQDVKDDILNVDARKLFEDYESNKINANEKYRAKRIKLSGIIKDIDTTFWTDKPTISLVTSEENIFATIDVTFKSDQIDSIKKLSKGQRITIIGRCESGSKYSIKLKDAVLAW